MGGRGTQEGRACPDTVVHPDPERFFIHRDGLGPFSLQSFQSSCFTLPGLPRAFPKIGPIGSGSFGSAAWSRALQVKHLLQHRGASSPPHGTLRVAVNVCTLVNTEQGINEHSTVLLLQLLPVKSPIQSQIKIFLFLLSGELQKHLRQSIQGEAVLLEAAASFGFLQLGEGLGQGQGISHWDLVDKQRGEPLLASCTRENLQNLSVQSIRALCILGLDFQEISSAKLALQVLDGANAPAGQGGTEVTVKSLSPQPLLLPEKETMAHFMKYIAL